MQRESLGSYREHRSARLKGHDEETGKRRYRGFLPHYLRNYAISYVREETPKYDARKHYAIRRMFEEALKDYALTLRYAAKAESARIGRQVSQNLTRGEDRRWVLLADEMKPLVSLFQNDINQMLKPIGMEAHIVFRPILRQYNPKKLRDRLRKKWRRMKPSGINVVFREKDQSTTGTQTPSVGDQDAKAVSILSKLQLTPKAKAYFFERGPANLLREIEGLQEGSYCLRCLNEGRGFTKTIFDLNTNVYICGMCRTKQKPLSEDNAGVT